MWFLIKMIMLFATSAILQYTVKNIKIKKFLIERQSGEDSPGRIAFTVDDPCTFTDNWTLKNDNDECSVNDSAPYEVNALSEFPSNVIERSTISVLPFEDKMVTKRPRIPVKNFSVAANMCTLSFDTIINKSAILKDYHICEIMAERMIHNDTSDDVPDVHYGMKLGDAFNASISLHGANKCAVRKIDNIPGYVNTGLNYSGRKTKQQFNQVKNGIPENGTFEYTLKYITQENGTFEYTPEYVTFENGTFEYTPKYANQENGTFEYSPGYVTLENGTLEYTLDSTPSSTYQTCERYIEFIDNYKDSVAQVIYRRHIKGYIPSALRRKLSREKNMLVKEYAQRYLKDMLMKKPAYQRKINVFLRYIKLHTKLINIVLKYLVKVAINCLCAGISLASKLLITTSKSCCNCASNFLQIVLNGVKRIMELSGFSFGQLYCLMLLVGFTLKIKLYYERKLEKLENDFEQHLESLHEILKTSTEDCKKQIEKYKMELEKSRIRSGNIMLAQIEKLEGMVVKLEAKRLLPPLGPTPPIPPPPPPLGLLPPFMLGLPPPGMTKQAPSQAQFTKPAEMQRCDQATKLDALKPQNAQVMSSAPTRLPFMQPPPLPSQLPPPPPPPPMFLPRAGGQLHLPTPPPPPPIFLPRVGGFQPNMRPNFEKQQDQANIKNNRKLYAPTVGGRCLY